VEEPAALSAAGLAGLSSAPAAAPKTPRAKPKAHSVPMQSARGGAAPSSSRPSSRPSTSTASAASRKQFYVFVARELFVPRLAMIMLEMASIRCVHKR
jgi:hypothetical protein